MLNLHNSSFTSMILLELRETVALAIYKYR
jgi:hypothetical protein